MTVDLNVSLTEPATYTLPNGSRLIVAPNHLQRTATAVLTFAVGSHHESEDVSGISHFFEHMAFKGSTTRTAKQIADEISAMGGQQNAVTSIDRTSYYINGMGRDVPRFIEMLYDMIINSTLDEEELERERQVVIQEYYSRGDEQGIVGWETIHELCYGSDTPFGRSIIGTMDAIESIDREQMVAFRDKHYVAENAIMSLIGGVTQEAVDTAIIYLNKLQSGIKLPYAQAPHIDCEPQVLQLWENRELNQTEVYMQWNLPSNACPNVVGAFSTIMGDGMGSILFSEVREKRGLVYDIGMYSAATDIDQNQILIASFATTKDKVIEVLEIIKSCIADVAKNGIDEYQLDNFKIMSEVSAARVFDSPASIARLMLRAEIGNTDMQSLIAINDADQNVTSEQVIELCKHVAMTDPTVVFVGGVDNIDDMFSDTPPDQQKDEEVSLQVHVEPVCC